MRHMVCVASSTEAMDPREHEYCLQLLMQKCGPLEGSISTANVAKAQHRLANFKMHAQKTNKLIFSGRWMSRPKECP